MKLKLGDQADLRSVIKPIMRCTSLCATAFSITCWRRLSRVLNNQVAPARDIVVVSLQELRP